MAVYLSEDFSLPLHQAFGALVSFPETSRCIKRKVFA